MNIAKFLIEKGADYNLRNKNGENAFDLGIYLSFLQNLMNMYRNALIQS